MTASASTSASGSASVPEGTSLDGCLWPEARRDELLHQVARAVGIARPAAPEWFQLRYEELAHGEPDLGARPPHGPAAVFRIEARDAGAPGALVAVIGRAGTGTRLLAPGGAIVVHPTVEVARLLRSAAERRTESGLDRVVARAQLGPARAAAVRGALLDAALAGEPVVQGWRVGAATASLAAALRQAGVARRLTLTSLAYAAQLALLVIAWWMVGARATTGGAAAAGLGPWLAVLGALIIARFAASWAAGRLAIDGGRILRARLMDGLLALDTQPLRAEGIGQLLGRVMETEAVESLALGGGLLAVAGLFELTTGAIVLALGATGTSQLAFLSLCLAAAVVLASRFWRALRRWSALRLALTHDLVERMVGHRTLVAQQPPELRHREEEQALVEYERASAVLDRNAAALAVVVPRGWLLVGVAALAPTLATSGGAAGLIATSLGGVLFVYGALRKLAQAFPALATAAVAWRQVAPLFAAADAASAAAAGIAPAAGGPAASTPAAAATVRAAAAATIASAAAGAASPVASKLGVSSDVLISARDVGFCYPGRTTPALAGCTFEIRRGDRVLLEGPSGGGKSTLATLIVGLRAPDVGALALEGTDQATLGLPRWRERVGVVPQFHENHVFSASVLFNLLLGRGWPPRREDVIEAEALCRELDLGGVLARMPSGLEQLIGESGWQLSHGERSRLFIARALLQKLDVRVLDESFAALDPETLERVLHCVLARADTLVVIAHP
jgi:ATP-binding cassette subfamily B protein